MEKSTAIFNRRQFLAGTMAGSVLMVAGAVGSPSLSEAAPEKHTPPTPQLDYPLLYKTPWGTAGSSDAAPFTLPDLPYAPDSLAPYISPNTIGFHYGKHHQGYINKINALVEKTGYAGQSLEQIIQGTAENPDVSAIFNNAAQAWNHSFYWKSMTPGGGGDPTGEFSEKIISDFGSLDNFKTAFKTAAASQFGSGWAWLVVDNGVLKVEKTANADTPLAHGRFPLLTLDVWEHAYYLDYQNRRGDYIDAWLEHLANWKFAVRNFSTVMGMKVRKP